jgi:hypothetical protein
MSVETIKHKTLQTAASRALRDNIAGVPFAGSTSPGVDSGRIAPFRTGLAILAQYCAILLISEN